jgi:Lipase (class 3)
LWNNITGQRLDEITWVEDFIINSNWNDDMAAELLRIFSNLNGYSDVAFNIYHHTSQWKPENETIERNSYTYDEKAKSLFLDYMVKFPRGTFEERNKINAKKVDVVTGKMFQDQYKFRRWFVGITNRDGKESAYIVCPGTNACNVWKTNLKLVRSWDEFIFLFNRFGTSSAIPHYDHVGMHEMHKVQSEQIMEFLESNMNHTSNATFHLTGHSLGGSLVQLLAMDIQKKFIHSNSTGSIF